MLINKNISQGDVVTIKLVSGEELMASFVEENENFIVVNKPRVLAATQNGIGIAPYLFTVDPDKSVKMYRSTIVILEPTEKSYASQYTENTSGIIV